MTPLAHLTASRPVRPEGRETVTDKPTLDAAARDALRQRIERAMAGSGMGEALHTALRKACFSDAASAAHFAITHLPHSEWEQALMWARDAAAEAVLDELSEDAS